jgi:hypothetical protein
MSRNIADKSISNNHDFVKQIQTDSPPLLHSTTAICKAPQRPDALCDICKKITLQYLESADDQDAPRPDGLSVPTNHVRRNAQNCPICRLLARFCFARYGAQPSSYDPQSSVDLQSNPDLMRRLAPDEKFEVSFLADAGGERSGRRLSVTMLPESSEYNYDDIGPTFHIFPVGADEVRRTAFDCRQIDPHRIDLSVVKLWLSNCEEKHQNSCDNVQWIHTKEDQFFWTIDVRNKRLRRTCGKDRFVALSYVSGKTTVSPFVETTEDFFALVDNETSLQSALEKLPRTIADAIFMVLEIGENLLWVDALCIPPSSKHRAAQIAFMDQIYGSAVLTIVAANGDNLESGLSGFRRGTRVSDHIVEQVGPSLALAVDLPHTIDAVTKAPWNNRGWTYQERLLSKRLVLFADETIFWQCKSLLAGEDVVLADKNESRIWWQGLKSSVDRMPSSESAQYSRQFVMQGDELFDDSYFWEYTDVVEEYSKRNSTLDSDMLAAFSGLSRSFAWAGKTDLLWGLPENRIDAALLWQKNFFSDRNPHHLRRRPTSVRFPSWTWAGWKGAVRYEPGVFDSSRVEYTRPCVGWFALKNGKLSLLSPTCSCQVAQDTTEETSSQIHHDVKEDNVHLKAISIAHPVPTDFCFTNQMLYGYTNIAPIVHFIGYLTETSRVRFTKPSTSTFRTKKRWGFEKSVQFRNYKQEITGGAELNGDYLYEADEIDLILMSERRRIDKFKNTDVNLSYKVMLVKWDRNGRTATRVGLGWIYQRVWWDASPTWREVILT